MSLTSKVTEDVQIVTVNAERIDAAVAIQFKEDMRVETERGPTRVVLDLSSVKFIDSSGLGAIVAAMKQLGKERRLDLARRQDYLTVAKQRLSERVSVLRRKERRRQERRR